MKVFQLIYGGIPEKISPCLESVKKYYPQVEVIHYPAVDNPIIYSDKERIEIVSSIDDILYLDWDIFINDELDIVKNGKPCFNEFKGQPDYSIIYSPDKSFWVGFEEERKRRGISKETYSWPRKILRDKNVNIIHGGFDHLRYS